MIVIIVNIIGSLFILLGGVCMKKVSNSHADYSIGYKTRRAVSSEEAWSFANRKCGAAWVVIGAAGFVFSSVTAFLLRDTIGGGYVQTALLVSVIAAVIVTAAVIERQLKSRFDK